MVTSAALQGYLLAICLLSHKVSWVGEDQPTVIAAKTVRLPWIPGRAQALRMTKRRRALPPALQLAQRLSKCDLLAYGNYNKCLCCSMQVLRGLDQNGGCAVGVGAIAAVTSQIRRNSQPMLQSPVFRWWMAPADLGSMGVLDTSTNECAADYT